MDYENNLVLVSKEESKVAVVTLNNPPLNLNTVASVTELREAFRKLEIDEDVNAIVLTGSGTKAFNVGTDMSYFPGWKGNYVGNKFRLESDVMNDIELCSKPVIAAIEGYCMGGGLELAMACDIRYMSKNSVVSLPECDLGVFCSSGGVVRLPKIVGMSKALEILYTCDRYSAQDCLEMGLVSKLFPVGEVVKNAVELAARIAAKPPKSIRTTKKACREFYNKDSIECYHKNLALVEDVYNSENAQEGVAAFLEKRDPVFKI